MCRNSDHSQKIRQSAIAASASSTSSLDCSAALLPKGVGVFKHTAAVITAAGHLAHSKASVTSTIVADLNTAAAQ
jgi:hypothetical protein